MATVSTSSPLPAPATAPIGLDVGRSLTTDRIAFIVWAACLGLMATMLLYDAFNALLRR